MDKMIIIGYGIFLLLGAFFGWKSGSKVSLIMGLVSSGLTFLGYYLTTLSPRNGFIFLSSVSAALAVVFVIRLLKTHKFMPSGGLLIITALFLLFCILRIPRN